MCRITSTVQLVSICRDLGARRKTGQRKIYLDLISGLAAHCKSFLIFDQCNFSSNDRTQLVPENILVSIAYGTFFK